MWLNIFRPPGSRPLSPIEMLTLFSAGKNEYKPAKEIISEMKAKSKRWNPEAGTVYPALHRLVEKGLLVKSPERKTSFRVSEEGYLFMTSISESICTQMEESFSFFEAIIDDIIEINPFEAEEIIERTETLINDWSKKLEKLKLKIRDEKTKGDWKTIDVEFK